MVSRRSAPLPQNSADRHPSTLETAPVTLTVLAPKPMLTQPRRRTVDSSRADWRDFATRARAIRARVARLLCSLKPTPDLRGRDLNALLQMLDRSDRSLEAVETRAGASLTITGPLRSPWSEPMAPSIARTAPRYSRQRWLRIAAEVRAIRSETESLREAIVLVSGHSTRAARFLGSLVVAVDEVTLSLAAVADRQHPGAEPDSAFYGPA